MTDDLICTHRPFFLEYNMKYCMHIPVNYFSCQIILIFSKEIGGFPFPLSFISRDGPRFGFENSYINFRSNISFLEGLEGFSSLEGDLEEITNDSGDSSTTSRLLIKINRWLAMFYRLTDGILRVSRLSWYFCRENGEMSNLQWLFGRSHFFSILWVVVLYVFIW